MTVLDLIDKRIAELNHVLRMRGGAGEIASSRELALLRRSLEEIRRCKCAERRECKEQSALVAGRD